MSEADSTARIEQPQLPEFSPLPTRPKFRNLTGQTFGRVIVVGFAGTTERRSYWWCRCQCGEIGKYHHSKLLNGDQSQCRDCRYRRVAESRTTHQKSLSTEYSTWNSMHTRCTNPRNKSYADYGGRGISVCERWRSFENFLADMGPRPSREHSIDRIDNNGNYCPENCRWSTRQEQCKNRRSTVFVFAFGETKTVTEWSMDGRCAVSRLCLGERIRKGWNAEVSITTPSGQFRLKEMKSCK